MGQTDDFSVPDCRDFTIEQRRILNKQLRAIAARMQNTQTEGAATAAGGSRVKVGPWGSRAGKVGDFYFASDRTVLILRTPTGWQYISGAMQGTLSPNEKPTDLAAGDAGFRFYSTDFCHFFMWDGAAWTLAPEDPIPPGVIVPGAPGGSEWAACDGTLVTIATSSGVTANITTPDLTGGVFIMGGGTSGGATAPSWGAASNSDSPSSTTEVQSGTGAIVASSTHKHSLLTAGLLPPSEADGGLPARVALSFRMRR